jgi:HEAT repeat protein
MKKVGFDSPTAPPEALPEEEDARAGELARLRLASTPPAGTERAPAPLRGERARRTGSRRIDPRSEGDAVPVEEHVVVPTDLSDPLGMAAGRSTRAKSTPPPRLRTDTPVRLEIDRRTNRYIRPGDYRSQGADVRQDDELPPPAAAPDPVDGGFEPSWIESSSSLAVEFPDSTPVPFESAFGSDAVEPPRRSSFPPPSDYETAVDDDALFARNLSAASPEAARPLIARAAVANDSLLAAVGAVFPGTLWFDRNRSRGRPPTADQASAPCAFLCAARERCVPVLAQLLASRDRTVRYCAAIVARQVHDAALVDPLIRMLVDSDSDNADIGMLALSAMDRALVEPKLSPLRAALGNKDAPPGQHLMAARTLGTLRDLQAVPLLVERTGSSAPDVAEAAHRALRTITGQGVKKSRFRWKRWLKKNGTRPRPEWLLEGLEDNDTGVRVVAMRELVLLTGEDLGLHRTARREDALSVRDQYRALLQERKGP